MKEVNIKEIKINPFSLIGDQWMLLTSGNKETGFNSMTIAWGQFGSIWSRPNKTGHLPTVVVYVRPQRYTREFIDRNDIFTVSSFDEKYKKDLAYLGSHSGRDEDKIKKVGFTPVFVDNTTLYKEASLTFVCKKIYQQTLKEECFQEEELISRNYPLKDFHDMYIGEIIKTYVGDSVTDSSLTDEVYNELKSSKKSPFDVIALFYNRENDNFSYVSFTMGNKATIERYLPNCDGKAIPIKLKQQALWVLADSKNSNMLIFRKEESSSLWFSDIKPSDIDEAKYIVSL